MKLSEKQKDFLNNKCIEKFGCTFDQMYKMLEESEKLKEENKKLKKQKRELIKC